MANSMIRGALPIVLTSAQQVSTDTMAIAGVIWIPSAVSHSFQLDDNQNNVIAQGSLPATGVLAPVVMMFAAPIPCSGLSLKAISAGDTLLVYPANI